MAWEAGTCPHVGVAVDQGLQGIRTMEPPRRRRMRKDTLPGGAEQLPPAITKAAPSYRLALSSEISRESLILNRPVLSRHPAKRNTISKLCGQDLPLSLLFLQRKH